jgi:hypothetical protein
MSMLVSKNVNEKDLFRENQTGILRKAVNYVVLELAPLAMGTYDFFEGPLCHRFGNKFAGGPLS